MSAGGQEIKGLQEHHLAGHFRSLIAEFGGSDEAADNLLSRFKSLEEDEDHMVTATIYRDTDSETMIGASWVELQFNPHRKSLTTVVYLAGLAKRELSKDLLNGVRQIFIPDKDTVVFENRTGRMLYINKNNTIITTPS